MRKMLTSSVLAVALFATPGLADADGGVDVSIGIGIPLPGFVYAAPVAPPVVYEPPVVYAPPVYYSPAYVAPPIVVRGHPGRHKGWHKRHWKHGDDDD